MEFTTRCAPESILKRRQDVITQRAMEKLVLLDVNGGEYFSLDEVGARVWDFCDGSRTASEVISMICQEYDDTSVTVEADVLGLLSDLLQETLLERHATSE